jgi:putative ABC transport system ATP-binding protein
LTSASLREAPKPPAEEKEKLQLSKQDDDGGVDGHRGFALSEKASRAAQVNLSARLSKDGSGAGQTGGFAEVWRLIKIAKPEAKSLGGEPSGLIVRFAFSGREVLTIGWTVAFVFLLMSSSITMSIPYVVRYPFTRWGIMG